MFECNLQFNEIPTRSSRRLIGIKLSKESNIYLVLYGREKIFPNKFQIEGLSERCNIVIYLLYRNVG